MNSDSITVIMPTLNSEQFITQALVSVESQEVSNLKTLVIDGGSSDATRSLAEEFPSVQVIDEPGCSLVAAWNIGLKRAASHFIAWLDSDDVWEPNALRSHLETLAKSPESVGSVGKVQFRLDGAEAPSGFRPDLADRVITAYMPGTTLITHATARAMGPFSENLGSAADIAWFARLRGNYMLATNPETVLSKRIHPGELSLKAMESGQYSAHLLRAVREHLQAGTHRSGE